MDINVEDTAEGRKKRVLVRKNVERRESDETMPLAAKDSEYVGLNFFSNKISSSDPGTSEEVQILDYNGNKTTQHPLIVLFPDLRDDPEAFQQLFNQLEPEQVTKKLLGKKPDFNLLKKLKRMSTIELHTSSTNPLLVISEEEKLPNVILSSPSEDSACSQNAS